MTVVATGTVEASSPERIPLIVDLDAHVVEPATVWSDRLPDRYAEVGPRVLELPAGAPKLAGAGYVEEPGTDGPPVAWWFYEDQRSPLKRTIVAGGYPADEVELVSVGYGDMRRGCFDPAARLADMDVNGVQAQMCFPNVPRFCGQVFLWGQDKELSRLCVEAYNDRVGALHAPARG